MTTACITVPGIGIDRLGAVIAASSSLHPERVADAATALLATGPEDHVLELGCGSGRLLARLAARARRGFVAGIDPSPLMVRHARHRNRRGIEAGRISVEAGRSDDLSAFAPASFDRVLGVHVACFWSEPQRDLTEVRRVLRPGGRLLLGFRPGLEAPPASGMMDPAQLPAAHVRGWLRNAGFMGIETHVRDAGTPLVWLRATR